VGHAHEAPGAQRRLAAAAVAEAQLARDQGVADVELVPVGEQVDVVEPDRVLALDPELEREPVGQVDEVLVEDRAAAEDRGLAVEDAVRVRARVVDASLVLPLGGPARAEVAVARRGQCLPQALLLGLEAVVREREIVVHEISCRPVGMSASE
jgi:hypothetical protein